MKTLNQKLSIVTLLFCSLAPMLLQASPQVAGKTIIARGDVIASSTTEDERALKRRSPIYDVDTVITGDDSRAQLRMADGGLVALQANTQLEIAEYEFDEKANKGKAVMKLLSGGIRTVTGKLKRENGDYKLETPVGSIGIRGTHYEVELIGDELFVAVWDGAIDLSLTIQGQNVEFSLGESADFNYMKVDTQGQITTFTEIPENFKDGHSASTTDGEQGQQDDNTEQNLAQENTQDNQQDEQVAQNSAEQDTTEQQGQTTQLEVNTDEGQTDEASLGEFDIAVTTQESPSTSQEVSDELAENIEINEELFNDLAGADESIIAERTGVVDFSDLVSHSITSSNGIVSNVQMNMQVNFDRQTIDDGVLSFDDPTGEWFATFNGVINRNALEMGINFASHGNNKADGEISGGFINEGTNIIGDIELSEINDPSSRAGGAFTLGESN
ncbi:FecR domain-containing protein [Catenovulum sp. SM1970]|uniref:FecR family protein n=1 Tax=Marinifaba aquimaris TaxID=2741323 RepID=UPI001571BB5E|nr:FecR family protein [Marinifaba aquimaris]NTS75728.1 FecR domain-containing protein [Marinifaba aquimaris]